MNNNVALFDLNVLEKICELSKNLIEGKTNFNDFEINLQRQGKNFYKVLLATL